MENRSWITAAGLAAALLAGSAHAQTDSPRPRPAVKAPSTTEAAGRHTMEGEVTKVDAKKGWVDVKTAEGRLKLHYPAPALDSVKAGDQVTVEIGLRAAR